MEDFLWKQRFLHILHVLSFPIEETFALTSNIYFKKDKSKKQEKTLTWVRQLSRNNIQKQPRKAESEQKVVGISQRRALLNCPCFLFFVSSSTAKLPGGKKATDRKGLQPLVLFIIGSIIMAKDRFFRIFLEYPCAILYNKHQNKNKSQFTLINIINLSILCLGFTETEYSCVCSFFDAGKKKMPDLDILIIQKAKCISLNNLIQLKCIENIYFHNFTSCLCSLRLYIEGDIKLFSFIQIHAKNLANKW